MQFHCKNCLHGWYFIFNSSCAFISQESLDPLRTMIEIISKYLLEKSYSVTCSSKMEDRPYSSKIKKKNSQESFDLSPAQDVPISPNVSRTDMKFSAEQMSTAVKSRPSSSKSAKSDKSEFGIVS